METKHLISIFKDYLANTSDQSAILINGYWGTGKTYFWKNTLAKIAEENGYKIIYVSLNGINHKSSIEQQIIFNLIPILGKSENKTLLNLSKFITNSMNVLTKFVTKSEIGDLLNGMSLSSFNFEKYVICFDDLERCEIPINQTFGYINNYTEHRKAKILILADESNLGNSTELFMNIKEKVITRTLNFETNTYDFLQEKILRYRENKASLHNLLSNHQNFILELLIKYKINNLRTVNFVIGILEGIEPYLPQENYKLIENLLTFVIVISNEFKTGEISASEYINPKNIKDSIHYSIEFEEEKEEKETIIYEQKFARKYLQDQTYFFNFYQSICTYILTGYLDVNNLKEEIETYNPKIVREQEVYDTIINYNFRLLSQEHFNELFLELIENIKRGAYKFYDFIHISKFLYFYKENNLISISKKEINDLIDIGLKKSLPVLNLGVFENLNHFRNKEEEEETQNPTFEKVLEIHNTLLKKEAIKKSNKLIQLLKDENSKEFILFMDDNQYSTEIFDYVEKEKLYETIVNLDNKRLNEFTRQIRLRYLSYENSYDFLSEDYELISYIKKNLIELKDLAPLKLFLMNELKDVLEKVLKKLKPLPTKN